MTTPASDPAPDDPVVRPAVVPDREAGDEAVPAVSTAADATPSAGRRRVVLLASIAGTIIVLDLITKIIAVATLTPGVSERVLGGLVYFSLIRNPGAAFSLATGMTWILAVVATIVVIVIIRMAPRLRSTPWSVCLGLILGGAVGNLIDRIFRAPGFMQGHVVDFVSVFGPNAEYFPIFNVADSAITVGGITLVVIALMGIDFDGTRVSGRRRGKQEAAGGSPDA